MPIKLDMGQAWNEAVAMIAANRQVIAIVAGVFFLLPNLAMSLFMPLPPTPPEASAGAAPDLEPVIEAMAAWFNEVWWMFLLGGLVQRSARSACSRC